MQFQDEAPELVAAGSASRPGRVLLVSAARDGLPRLLRPALEDEGLVCDHADSPALSVARVARGPVDLLLLDLNLPEFSALELILCLRRFRPGLPIVALAGQDSELASAARLLGAHATLPQPVDCAALLETIRFLLPDAVYAPRQRSA